MPYFNSLYEFPFITYRKNIFKGYAEIQIFNQKLHELKRELERYENIQEEARKGYSLLPNEMRTPIETAADAYAKTAHEIYAKPLALLESNTPSEGRA